MQFDDTSAEHLGWNEILTALADRAVTPQGRECCLALRPVSDPETIQVRQQRCQQLGRLVAEGRNLPIDAIDEIGPELDRARKHGLLTAEAVQRVAQAMRISSLVRRFLIDAGPEARALVDLARDAHDLLSPGRDLLDAFDEMGELRDSASPELAKRRKSARSTASHIRSKLERIMRKTSVASCLSDQYITQRADRFVLPVRADMHQPFAGIVHDTSQTGATLFIEPTELLEDGNRLKIAQRAVQEEEQRILAEYSDEIARHASALADNLVCLARADLVMAAEELGRRLRGSFPQVGGKGFFLNEARHPLMALDPGPVVTNSIRLTPAQRCLVITGPNAGGKTVTLKSMGLIAMMAQAGLPTPVADGSRIGLFQHLHAVMGDAQDLHSGLSTFSAHVAAIGRILPQADEDTLVLLDEVTADTDPSHGAALAAALLAFLTRRGATTVVTTHYEELKHLAYHDDHFANASVGFDLDTMQPSYTLHPDLPGRSLTLAIARRLGIPEEILAAAEASLDGGESKVDDMLDSLEEERGALSRLRLELAQEKGEAGRKAQEHAQAAQSLSQEKEDLQKTGRDDLLADIRQIRGEVASLIESLRRKPSLPAAGQVSEKLKSTEERLRKAAQTPAPTAPTALGSLQTGDRVRILSLNKEGQVTAIDTRAEMISVRIGGMRTRVPAQQVERISAGPLRRPKVEVRVDAVRAPRPETEVRTPENTLDLRGQRVDEALARLDKFLDELFGAERETVFIIHGHGTGALRAAIRDYLQDSAYPRHFRTGAPEEGGDGITVVKLK